MTIANEGLSKWIGIVEIKEAGNYLLFRINDYPFHVIPKRSFQTNEEYEKFLSFSKHEWAIAHNKLEINP
jgi:YcxB-like protein